jgi:hypothetical protein
MNAQPYSRSWYGLVSIVFTLLLAACVHKIHVTANPEAATMRPIAGTAEVRVKFLALEGPDHMPGIVLLEWPAQDLQRALVDYLSQRQTFAAVGTEPGDWRLSVNAWLTMRAPDNYVYRLHLEAELSKPDGSVVKRYAADGEAPGEPVRWVTRSDQKPIEAATNQAFHELTVKLEEDRETFN